MDLQQTLTSNMKDYRKFILAADVGGTNTRFAVVGIGSSVGILLSHSFKTKWIHFYTKVSEIVEKIRKTYGIELKDISIGASGIVKNNSVNLTNIKRKISVDGILKETPIKNVLLMNDFETAGYGINAIDKGKDVKLLIGPGTGLGKAVLVWNNGYFPLPSEGGHAELVYHKEEKKLVSFIKKKRKKEFLEWEDVLSGRGVEDINEFLTKKKIRAPKVIDKAVFELFSKYFARCCRNFALEVSCSKIYVIGGVAQHHPEILKGVFRKEFEKGTFRSYLKSVKVELIKDELLGLYGAGYAWKMKKGENIK